jgi:RNA-binding protein
MNRVISARVTLTGKQRRYLRGLGHALAPVVQVGKGGVDDGVVHAVDAALTQHELIKVKLGPEAPEGRDAVAEALSTRTRSEVAQILGRTILLYRRHPKEPKIVLPRASADSQ